MALELERLPRIPYVATRASPEIRRKQRMLLFTSEEYAETHLAVARQDEQWHDGEHDKCQLPVGQERDDEANDERDAVLRQQRQLVAHDALHTGRVVLEARTDRAC